MWKGEGGTGFSAISAELIECLHGENPVVAPRARAEVVHHRPDMVVDQVVDRAVGLQSVDEILKIGMPCQTGGLERGGGRMFQVVMVQDAVGVA